MVPAHWVVQCAGVGDEAKAVSLPVIYPLLSIFMLLSPWLELCAVGGEGHLDIFPMFISVLRESHH
jgi:hypothetical protein